MFYLSWRPIIPSYTILVATSAAALNKMREECIAKGGKYEHLPPPTTTAQVALNLQDLFMKEIREQQQQQQAIIDKGLTLGYGFAEADTDISKEKTETLIELVSEVVIGNMNDVYRDAAYSRKWTTQKGHTFTARFVYTRVEVVGTGSRRLAKPPGLCSMGGDLGASRCLCEHGGRGQS